MPTLEIGPQIVNGNVVLVDMKYECQSRHASLSSDLTGCLHFPPFLLYTISWFGLYFAGFCVSCFGALCNVLCRCVLRANRTAQPASLSVPRQIGERRVDAVAEPSQDVGDGSPCGIGVAAGRARPECRRRVQDDQATPGDCCKQYRPQSEAEARVRIRLRSCSCCQ